MRKYYCLFFIVFLGSRWAIYSQEVTAEDSLWIQRIQDGTENIQLNEATRKAIESGTLIRDPFSTKQLKTSPSEMPIIKSFENITMPENRPKPQDIPISVYKIYVQHLNLKDSLPAIGQGAAGFGAVYGGSEEVGKGVGVGVSMGFSAEDILRAIFWPSHRAKKRNAKNANAWKTYNEY